MDSACLFLTLVGCLLAHVETGSNWERSSTVLKSLRSHFRQHRSCNGGNLIKIDTNQCKVSSAGKRQCKAKCDGSSTRNPNARFVILENRGRKCIQFTDEQDCTKYALKVISGTNVTFEEQPRCDSTTDNDFLFEEEKVGKLFKYRYTANKTQMCLGVTSDCDGNLSLIKSANNQDRRCSFRVLLKQSRKLLFPNANCH